MIKKLDHNRRLTISKWVTMDDVKADKIKMLRAMLRTKLTDSARKEVTRKLKRLGVKR